MRAVELAGLVVEGGEDRGIEFVLGPKGVGLHGANVRVAQHQFAREGIEGRIDVNGNNCTCRVGEARGERAGAAADFEDQVLARQFGGANDKVEDIEIDEEILAELPFRFDASLGEQVAQVRQSLAR